MLLTTTENIPGKNYEILGLVKGNMIQTKNIGRDISQGLKSIVGGELKNYVKMMNESRSIATQRMVEEADGLFLPLLGTMSPVIGSTCPRHFLLHLHLPASLSHADSFR